MNSPAISTTAMPWPCKLILLAFALPVSVLVVAAVAWTFFSVRYGATDGPAVIWLFFGLLWSVGIGGALQVLGVWQAERHFETIPEQRTGMVRAVIVAGMCSAAFAAFYLLVFALTWNQA